MQAFIANPKDTDKLKGERARAEVKAMRCSTDLRQRVLGFVGGGGSKAEAARRFQVGIASVYRWVGAADGLTYQRPGPRGLKCRKRF